MELTVRKAVMDDIDDLVMIEDSAIPGYSYVYDDRFFFLEQQGNKGEMVLVEADGKPAGMGQYSVMPDGSGWLECLRVHKDYQHHGVGKLIYRRYLELAAETGAPSIAMFTGWKNAASRGLAELNGLSLAGAYAEYVLDLKDIKRDMPAGFRVVESVDEAVRLIDENRAGWGNFMVLNRTFMHYGRNLYAWLINHHMIYTDGENTVVLGCRMLEERGWYIGFFSGNADRCFAFAEAMTAEKGLPELTVSFPPERNDLAEFCMGRGYKANGERIVMERIL